jgi:hypothetical protein
MIREKVSYKDFHRIAKENEYFLWHFVQKEQEKNGLVVSSVLDGNKEKNPLKELLDYLDIPYYESYTEESMDFLMGLGHQYSSLYHIPKNSNIVVNPNFKFSPVIVGFKKFTKVLSSIDTCYCIDGIIRILNELNPIYLEQIMDYLEKNPD